MKRITAVTGHFGSGKTEFAVNLACKLKETREKVAIIDLDIANPYFRSRERQAMFEEKGIVLYSNTFGKDLAVDIPAITADVRAPLESGDTFTVVDVGGNDSGARVMNQFRKYFKQDCADTFCVINANRPETDNKEGAVSHLLRIEYETGIRVTGIINNTHLLRETEAEHAFEGYKLCKEVSEELDIPIVANCIMEEKAADLAELARDITDFKIFPLKLYMRPAWLDR